MEWNEEDEHVENLEESKLESSQVNEVKEDSGSGLHNIDKKPEGSRKSSDHDTDHAQQDVDKISLDKNSKENSMSQNEKQEPSQTLEEIIVKQKGTGISAADRWKSLKKTIDEKRTDPVRSSLN